MKQVININFQGRVVPIEVSAFDILKAYTESLGRYFANEDGKDEIINDIESRIGELFQERIKTGTTCITDDDVNAIIRSMGRPEDFETTDAGATASEKSSSFSETTAGAYTQSATANNSGTKRLFRDENDKVIGGVCGGLASYFNIDVVVVRIIFVVLAVSFGFGLISYLILWVAVPSSATVDIGATRKKLYRDSDNKLLAGVCSGIGNYFGVNAWIPRVLFLLPFLGFISRYNESDFGDFLRIGFSPGSLLIYIILWIVIPEALSTTEKLEMKGEKVDMNSIKNSIVGEMKGVQDRAEKFSKQASSIAGEKSKAFAAEASTVVKRSSRSLGDIIALLFKVFVYFIAGCIGFAFVVGLFAFAIFAIGIFPMKDFLLTDGWQTAFAWGTLIFFIAVPIIGIITWIIRRMARIKSNRRAMIFTFVCLWIVGWFCFISLIASLGREFKSNNDISEQEIELSNPNVNKLEITSIAPNQKIFRNRWFKLQPFEGVDEDTAYIGNISVHIVKSPTDSFRVTMLKLSNGRTQAIANRLADIIEFGATQNDSILVVDKGIAINKKDKFRNQRVVLTIYVPVGKQIRIDRSVGWLDNVNFDGPWTADWDINYGELEHGWNSNETYIMKPEGLFTLDGSPADDRNNDNGRNDEGIDIRSGNSQITIDSAGIKIRNGIDENNYRYRNDVKTSTIDSGNQEQKYKEQRITDSLQKVNENLKKQLEKMNEKAKDPTAYIPHNIPGYNPLLILY